MHRDGSGWEVALDPDDTDHNIGNANWKAVAFSGLRAVIGAPSFPDMDVCPAAGVALGLGACVGRHQRRRLRQPVDGITVTVSRAAIDRRRGQGGPANAGPGGLALLPGKRASIARRCGTGIGCWSQR